MAGLIVSLLLGFIPMFLFAAFVNWMDKYEKEPKLLLGAAFTWGAMVAAGGAFILNTTFGVATYLLTGSEGAADVLTAVVSAPLIEESLKGAAVLFIFLVFYREFDSVLDGIIYAAVTALGFAATENVIYIYRGFESNGWQGLTLLAFIRIVVVGWQHPFYTSFTGIGLAQARLHKNWFARIGFPLLGLFVAMSAHALHNLNASLGDVTICLIGTLVDWFFWILMFLFILFMIWRERGYLRTYLMGEAKAGILSNEQYFTVASVFKRDWILLKSIFNGKFFQLSRFYQVCGELAHKNRQMAKLGNEGGNQPIVQKLRAEMSRLSKEIGI